MESILPDLPPLPRRRITLPLSTLAEVAREVCDGYDPPARGRAYAKAHPLWREVPAPPPPPLKAAVPPARAHERACLRLPRPSRRVDAHQQREPGQHDRPQRQDGPPPARPD